LPSRPDLADCSRTNAVSFVRLPEEFGNPATCLMHGQVYLGETSIGRDLVTASALRSYARERDDTQETTPMFDPNAPDCPGVFKWRRFIRSVVVGALLGIIVAAVIVALIIFFAFYFDTTTTVALAPAQAQMNHEAGHLFYRNWVNQQGTGCCNNQDCGELADHDVRSGHGSLEVRIEGEWCPVRPWMYLKSGNAPDWSTAHVCVVKDSEWLTDRRPCSRLVCFQPKPGS
jgi:hypothetical protein